MATYRQCFSCGQDGTATPGGRRRGHPITSPAVPRTRRLARLESFPMCLTPISWSGNLLRYVHGDAIRSQLGSVVIPLESVVGPLRTVGGGWGPVPDRVG